MQRGSKIRKNGELRGLPRIRVIGSSGAMMGVMTLAEALRLAFKEGLDLVEVGPTASPPICKILDFDGYKYDENKGQPEGQWIVSPCGRFLIDDGRVGLVTFEDGADRGHLEWEMPNSGSTVDVVIFGESGWWFAPEARKMSKDEVRDLARELAAAMRLRIELWLSEGPEIIWPPERRA
jgi:translation initiation factor IF-3-like protein